MKIDEAIGRIEEHMRVHKLAEPHAHFINIALEMAIQALRVQQERLGKAWVMYENEGAICPNCIEHVCKGWSFCPECGEELPAPPEPKEG